MKGLFKGLLVTLRHIGRPAFTIPYPFVKKELPKRTRGRHALLTDPETGLPLCIGCQQCSRVCPDKLITIKTSKAPEGSPKKISIDDFEVDLSACMFCGLCAEVCPQGGIVMTNFYEMATEDKKGLKMSKEKLIESQKDYAGDE